MTRNAIYALGWAVAVLAAGLLVWLALCGFHDGSTDKEGRKR